MKSIVVKLIIAGLLAVGLLAFCPYVMPTLNQAFTPPVVHKPKVVSPPPGVKHVPKIEDLVLKMTNQARRAKGLAPLNQDNELTNVARAFSDDMLLRHFFDHTTPDGVPFYRRIRSCYPHWVRTLGENIWEAYGYEHNTPKKLAQLIVSDWMSSPGHRDNILDPDFTHLGVGVSVRHNLIKVTQEFVGRPRAFSGGQGLTLWLNGVCTRVQPAL